MVKQILTLYLVYKHEVLEKIIDFINPSFYTLESLFLSIFKTPNDSLKYIKNKKIDLKDMEFHSKDALIVYVKLVDKISNSKYPFELLDFSYVLISKLLYFIINTTRDKTFVDVFESNKICLKLYFNCINSMLVPLDDMSFISTIKLDLINIIEKTINEHDNPFYFNLILALYCTDDTDLTIIDYIEIIVVNLTLEGTKDSISVSRYNLANSKNMLLLIYSMLFVGNQNKQIFKDEKFIDITWKFFIFLTKTQLIFTKMSFDSYACTKKANECQKRTILEMLFEILIELYHLWKSEKYIKFLENILIINEKHTVFSYIDTFYFFTYIKTPQYITENFDRNILDVLDTKIFRKETANINLSTIYFLIKILCYMHVIEKKKELDQKEYGELAILHKFSIFLIADLKKLIILNSINKLEIKGIYNIYV